MQATYIWGNLRRWGPFSSSLFRNNFHGKRQTMSQSTNDSAPESILCIKPHAQLHFQHSTLCEGACYFATNTILDRRSVRGSTPRGMDTTACLVSTFRWGNKGLSGPTSCRGGSCTGSFLVVETWQFFCSQRPYTVPFESVDTNYQKESAGSV